MLTPQQILERVISKRFWFFLGIWALCFLLLFFLYFVADFYVIVGSGPGSWKKSTPLSFPERLVLSAVFATMLSGILAVVYACFLFIRRLIRRR